MPNKHTLTNAIDAAITSTGNSSSTAGISTLAVPSRGQFVRAAWTVSGSTPSFTTAIALMSGA